MVAQHVVKKRSFDRKDLFQRKLRSIQRENEYLLEFYPDDFFEN